MSDTPPPDDARPQPPGDSPDAPAPQPIEPPPNVEAQIEAVEQAAVKRAKGEATRQRLPLTPSAAPLVAPEKRKPIGKADADGKPKSELPTLKNLRDRLKRSDEGGSPRAIPKSLLQMETLLALGTTLVAIIVYGSTLSPDVTFGNSGELATAVLTGGVPHPSGYPTFILFTRLLATLIRAFTKTDIAAVNFTTAALTALSAFFLHRWLSFTQLKLRPALAELAPDDPEVAARLNSLRARRDRVLLAAAATSGALYLAFGRFVWARANSIEVYGVQAFLLAAVLYFFCRACYYDDYQPFNLPAPEPSPSDIRADQKRRRRLWIVFSLLLGLAFGSHLTTLLLLPAMLYLYFVTQGVGAASLRRLVVNGLIVGLGTLIYLTLMHRAGSDPVVNWGNPSTPEALWRHIRGLTGSPMQDLRATGSLAGVLAAMPSSFTIVVLLLAAVGLVRSWQTKPSLAMFTGAILLTAFAYLALWSTPDQRAAGLIIAVIVAFWAGLGVTLLLLLIGQQPKPIRYALAAVPVLYGAFLGYANHDDMDRSKNRIVREYALNVLSQADSSAVLLTSQWDSFASPALYYQNILIVRPDVSVIETELCRRPWYLEQLRTTQSALVARAEAALDTLRQAARQADAAGQPLAEHDPQVVAGLRAMIERTLAANLPVYVTGELPEAFPAVVSGLLLVPEGIFYQLRAPGDTQFRPTRRTEFRMEELRTYRAFRSEEVALASLYLRMLVERGDYLRRMGRPLAASGIYGEALTVPESPQLMPLHQLAARGRAAAQADSARGVIDPPDTLTATKARP